MEVVEIGQGVWGAGMALLNTLRYLVLGLWIAVAVASVSIIMLLQQDTPKPIAKYTAAVWAASQLFALAIVYETVLALNLPLTWRLPLSLTLLTLQFWGLAGLYRYKTRSNVQMGEEDQ